MRYMSIFIYSFIYFITNAPCEWYDADNNINFILSILFHIDDVHDIKYAMLHDPILMLTIICINAGTKS